MNEKSANSDAIQAQFTAQVDRFVSAPHVNAPEPLRRFLALAEPRAGERAIDVGCGPGLLAKAVAPLVASFVGIDLTHAMVRKAAGIAPGARFCVGDATALPVRDGSIDLALTRLALHHMPRPEAAIAAIARALRPGGRLAVFDQAGSEVAEEAEHERRIETLRDPSHARALPISELAALLGKSGLALERLETMEFDLDVEDWIARSEPPRADADEARRLIAAAEGTRRFGGRRVFRDGQGKWFFVVRWMMVLARKP